MSRKKQIFNFWSFPFPAWFWLGIFLSLLIFAILSDLEIPLEGLLRKTFVWLNGFGASTFLVALYQYYKIHKPEIKTNKSSKCPMCGARLIINYLNIEKGKHNSCDKGKLKCQKCGQKLPDLPHIRHWLIFWVGLPVSLLLGAFCAIITSLLLKSLLGESRNITMLFVTVSLISGTALGIFLINKLLSRWL